MLVAMELENLLELQGCIVLGQASSEPELHDGAEELVRVLAHVLEAAFLLIRSRDRSSALTPATHRLSLQASNPISDKPVLLGYAMAKNIPRHVGFIPDGNRRWAMDHGLPKEAGYAHGINPGLLLYEKCKECGIKEISIYGFTQDNTSRPSVQKQAFSEACIAFAFEIARRGAALLVVGDETSTQFPKVLKEFRHRQGVGMKVNLLVNYGWEWDLAGLKNGGLRSDEVSRLDLIVRWGGGRRLSGFLPVQSVYADFYVREEYWPDFDLQHLEHALAWFKNQDPTLGG